MGKDPQDNLQEPEKDREHQEPAIDTTLIDPEDIGPNSTVIIGGGDPNLSPTAGKPLI